MNRTRARFLAKVVRNHIETVVYENGYDSECLSLDTVLKLLNTDTIM